ncbi:unnamed protein product [Hymenolepis diminuta]|uniref:Uncharacterized protein n=1 Tax=Hymenolepis diminuta TaxID=6216 RepID=A0A564Y9H1_HYMDI|nr:unnamed protein product [Hymenolepis diminuta]
MPTSSQPPSPSTKLQTINYKLRPSVLLKAKLTRKCNTCNLLAVNNKNQVAEPPPTTVNYLLLANPNSVLPKPSPVVPPDNVHPILVSSLPLKILYNLPLSQSSPHSKTLLNLPLYLFACLDPNSLALVSVEELTFLPDWPIMYNN